MKITTERRSDDFIAYANDDKRVWEAGKTADEASLRLQLRLCRESSDQLLAVLELWASKPSDDPMDAISVEDWFTLTPLQIAYCRSTAIISKVKSER